MPSSVLEIAKVLIILLTSGLNALLGSIVLQRNPRHKINITFFLLALSYAVWAICLLLYDYPLILTSYFWVVACYAFVIAHEVFILQFSFIFPTDVFKKARPFAIAYTVLYIVFSSWLLFFTKYWIEDVVIDPQKGLQTVMGPGYSWWVIATWGILGWAIANYIIHALRSKGIQRIQLVYLFFGFTLWGIAINIPDVILPIFYQDTRYFSISAVASLAFTGSVTYAIIKHRFMDIRFVVARSMTYSLLVLSLGIGYAGGLFLINAYISGIQTSIPNLAIATGLALVIAFTYQPLLRYFEKITNTIFFKDHYYTDELVLRLSQALSSTINLRDLSLRVLGLLQKHMHISGGVVVIQTSDSTYTVHNTIQNSINSALFQENIHFFSEKTKPIVFEEQDESEMKQLMREANIMVCIRLHTTNTTSGYLLLGAKKSGDIFFDQDVKILNILAPSFAIALQDALSYEKILQFNITLQEQIDKATGDLKMANRQLEKLDQLKDEFVSVASHELRTPMTAIKSYVWLALNGRGGQIDQKARDYLGRVYQSTERLIHLVNEMLDISRIESGRVTLNYTSFSVHDLLLDIQREFQAKTAELSLKLTIDMGGNIPSLFADREKIHQVMENLVGNACKFTDAGGAITLRARREGDFIEIEIQDTGHGIKKEDMSKLFTKFGRLEHSLVTIAGSGSGLGLYISRQYVLLHGGDIWANSEIGKGSTFSFTLPVANASQVPYTEAKENQL